MVGVRDSGVCPGYPGTCVDSISEGYLTIDVPCYKGDVFDVARNHEGHCGRCCFGCDDGLTRG